MLFEHFHNAVKYSFYFLSCIKIIYNSVIASEEVAVPWDEGRHRFETERGSFGKFTPLYMPARRPST
jgi:hypothetical protein